MAEPINLRAQITVEDGFSKALNQAAKASERTAREIAKADDLLRASSGKVDKATRARLAPSKELKFAMREQAAQGNKLATQLVHLERAHELAKVKMQALLKAGIKIPPALIKQANASQKAAAALRKQQKATQETGQASTSLRDEIEQLRTKYPGLLEGVAITGLLAKATWDLVTSAANAGDAVFDMSRRFGLAAETVSRMQFVATQSGSSMLVLGKAMQTLSKNAVTGTATFKKWGLQLENADGTIKSSEQLFLDAADLVANLGSEVEQTAAAQDLFGGSGAKLLQVLKLGREGIKALSEEHNRLGLTISQESAAAANDFNNNLGATVDVINSVKRELGEELIPTAKFYVNLVKETVNELRHWKETAAAAMAVMGPFHQVLQLNIAGLKGIASVFSDEVTPNTKEAKEETAALGQAAGGAVSGINKAGDSAKNAAKQFQKMADRAKKAAQDFAQFMVEFGADIEREFDKQDQEAGARMVERAKERSALLDEIVKANADRVVELNRKTDEAIRKQDEERESRQKSAAERQRERDEAARDILIDGAKSISMSWASALGEIASGAENSGEIIKAALINTAEKAIMSAAAAAAAQGAFATAGIPIIGPILAPAAAATLFAFVRGFLTKMEKGGEVKGGFPGVDSVPVLAQRGEGFLSVEDTKTIKELIGSLKGARQPGGESIGGGMTNVFNFQSLTPPVGAESSRAARQMIKMQRRAMKRGVM